MEAINTLTQNGFEVTADDAGYHVKSLATGAYIARGTNEAGLREYARGIEYSLGKNIDKWTRPIRETGYYAIHD